MSFIGSLTKIARRNNEARALRVFNAYYEGYARGECYQIDYYGMVGHFSSTVYRVYRDAVGATKDKELIKQLTEKYWDMCAWNKNAPKWDTDKLPYRRRPARHGIYHKHLGAA